VLLCQEYAHLRWKDDYHGKTEVIWRKFCCSAISSTKANKMMVTCWIEHHVASHHPRQQIGNPQFPQYVAPQIVRTILLLIRQKLGDYRRQRLYFITSFKQMAPSRAGKKRQWVRTKGSLMFNVRNVLHTLLSCSFPSSRTISELSNIVRVLLYCSIPLHFSLNYNQ
jgi:hypothetical protein